MTALRRAREAAARDDKSAPGAGHAAADAKPEPKNSAAPGASTPPAATGGSAPKP
jgi:hypothetical protein